MKKEKARDIIICSAIVLIIYIILPFLLQISYLRPIKYYLEDFDVTDMYYSKIKPDIPDTNIVLINTENLSYYNIARNIQEVLKQNPTVIGFVNNINFDDLASADDILRNTLMNDDRIVVSHPLVKDESKQKDIINRNIELYKTSGFSNLLFGKDKDYYTIRKFSPFYETEDRLYQSFAYQVSMIYNPKSVNFLLARNKQYERINFTGMQESFFNVDPFDFEKDTFVQPDYIISLSNKIVLFGEIRQLSDNRQSSRFDDMYFTPISKTSVWDFNIPDMHNTVIQANIISTIINEKYIDEQPLFTEYMLFALMIFFNCWLFITIIEKFSGLNYLAGIIIMPIETTLIVYLCFNLIENNNFLFDINPTLISIPLSFFVTDIMAKYFLPWYYGKKLQVKTVRNAIGSRRRS